MSILIISICSVKDLEIVREIKEKVILIKFGPPSNVKVHYLDGILRKLNCEIGNYYDFFECDLRDVKFPFFNRSVIFESLLMFLHEGSVIKIDIGTGPKNSVLLGFPDKEEILGLMVSVYIGVKSGKTPIIFPVCNNKNTGIFEGII